MSDQNFVWAIDENGKPAKCRAKPENRGKRNCKHKFHNDKNLAPKEFFDKYIPVYNLEQDIKNKSPEELRKQFNNCPDVETFLECLKTAKTKVTSKKAWRVAIPTPDEFKEEHSNALIHKTEKGSVVAIAEDGDLFSLCVADGDAFRGHNLIEFALSCGAFKFDSYEGNHAFYHNNGFIPVSWCKWDSDYAPDDWKPEYGEEDVIFYIHKSKLPKGFVKENNAADIGEWKLNHESSEDYFAASTEREELISQLVHNESKKELI